MELMGLFGMSTTPKRSGSNADTTHSLDEDKRLRGTDAQDTCEALSLRMLHA